ncbi:MAG: hypothetical protein PHP37_00245 [Patescibacteria group bacterium]|nr:hypothetical protein [Patescibacteria group bacterium]
MALKRENCPQAILDIIFKSKNEVISQAQAINIENGNIPFLPVLSANLLFPDKQFGRDIEMIDENEVYFIYNVNHHDFSNRPMQFTKKNHTRARSRDANPG